MFSGYIDIQQLSVLFSTSTEEIKLYQGKCNDFPAGTKLVHVTVQIVEPVHIAFDMDDNNPDVVFAIKIARQSSSLILSTPQKMVGSL
jgi:hypothetical protein